MQDFVQKSFFFQKWKKFSFPIILSLDIHEQIFLSPDFDTILRFECLQLQKKWCFPIQKDDVKLHYFFLRIYIFFSGAVEFWKL